MQAKSLSRTSTTFRQFHHLLSQRWHQRVYNLNHQLQRQHQYYKSLLHRWFEGAHKYQGRDEHYPRRWWPPLLHSIGHGRGGGMYDDVIPPASIILQISRPSHSWIDHHIGRTFIMTVVCEHFYRRTTYIWNLSCSSLFVLISWTLWTHISCVSLLFIPTYS